MGDTIEAIAARRPSAEFEASLTSGNIEAFEVHGFTSIDRITTDEEVVWLKELYDAIFEAGVTFDLARPYASQGENTLPQVIKPEERLPDLRKTLFWRNGRKLAAQLMQLDETLLEGWGHMIRKPARIGEVLPWHQDEAYWDPALVYRALGCWMPLDDATAENGAMKFIPGSHTREIQPHAHVGGDPITPALYTEVDPAEEAKAVLMPLRAAGAIFHHSRTLHASGPNRTDKARRAYANEWQLSPVKAQSVPHRPWIEESRQAFAELRRS